MHKQPNYLNQVRYCYGPVQSTIVKSLTGRINSLPPYFNTESPRPGVLGRAMGLSAVLMTKNPELEVGKDENAENTHKNEG